MLPVPSRVVLDLQDAIQAVGQRVSFVPAGGSARDVRARVRYATDAELVNAIENYRLVATFDAREFTAAPPLKGDSVVIDGTRRGVVWMRQIRASGGLIAYQCGVQG
jgi:hypothetical protein